MSLINQFNIDRALVYNPPPALDGALLLDSDVVHNTAGTVAYAYTIADDGSIAMNANTWVPQSTVYHELHQSYKDRTTSMAFCVKNVLFSTPGGRIDFLIKQAMTADDVTNSAGVLVGANSFDATGVDDITQTSQVMWLTIPLLLHKPIGDLTAFTFVVDVSTADTTLGFTIDTWLTRSHGFPSTTPDPANTMSGIFAAPQAGVI